jgi:hypothetical protein
MTKVLWAIVDEYLEAHEEELKGVEVVKVHHTKIRRSA